VKSPIPDNIQSWCEKLLKQ